MSFYYVYKALAHPEWSGYVTPFTIEERLMHVKEAQRTLGSRFTWICDNMDNEFKHAMGNAPNSEWVIDENNVIVRRRDWSSHRDLRKDLEELVGPIANPTRVEDLDLPTAPPTKAAASGVVERMQRQGRMMAVSITPIQGEDKEPFYAKLRAEADRDLLENGEGQLYLRFMLDPLYDVHWNNLADGIQVEIETPDGVKVSPSTLKGPEVEVESDIDPREFLVDISGAEAGTVIKINTFYFACHDEQGWCKPISQSYEVRLERNRDGGSVISGRIRGRMGGQRGRRPGANRPPPQDRAGMDRALLRIVGRWNMTTELTGQSIDAVMTLSIEDGKLAGNWASQSMEMPLKDLSLDGRTLSFTRSVGEQSLNFTGEIDGDSITGTYSGGFGDLSCNGQRER